MKRFSIEVVVAAVAVMIAHSARGELVDRVAAVVNTQIITLSEVEKRAAPELATLADSKDKAAHRDKIIHEALDQLVADKLMDWQLQEQHVEVSDQEVDGAAENLKVQNKLDNAQLEKALAEQGMTVASWKNDVLRKQLARLKLIRAKVEQKVKISDPVRTSFGWHVIKLEERRALPVKSYQDMQGMLREKLRSAQLEKASESYIRELKQSAVVELKI
jgi:parvulin-like peptidyl-prolyl isomerase